MKLFSTSFLSLLVLFGASVVAAPDAHAARAEICAQRIADATRKLSKCPNKKTAKARQRCVSRQTKNLANAQKLCNKGGPSKGPTRGPRR